MSEKEKGPGGGGGCSWEELLGTEWRVSENWFLCHSRELTYLKIATGFRYTSLFSPQAWLVELPSKFQIGKSSMLVQGSSSVLVLPLRETRVSHV